jgi:hypothetical protein
MQTFACSWLVDHDNIRMELHLIAARESFMKKIFLHERHCAMDEAGVEREEMGKN